MEDGVIIRTDKYTPAEPLQVARTSLEFASYSDGAAIKGKTVRFAHGAVTDFEVSGLDACEVKPTMGAEPYRSPAGPMRTHVSCAKTNFTFASPLTIKWTMRYR